MTKIGKFIAKHKYLILVISLILLVTISAFLSGLLSAATARQTQLRLLSVTFLLLRISTLRDLIWI